MIMISNSYINFSNIKKVTKNSFAVTNRKNTIFFIIINHVKKISKKGD